MVFRPSSDITPTSSHKLDDGEQPTPSPAHRHLDAGGRLGDHLNCRVLSFALYDLAQSWGLGFRVRRPREAAQSSLLSFTQRGASDSSGGHARAHLLFWLDRILEVAALSDALMFRKTL